jgi:ubiquitin-conjugating enzyme E2 O
LDGTVEVVLADGTTAAYPLERLTKLYDGMDQLEDLWGDEDFTDDDSQLTDELMEILSEDPLQPGEEEGGEWEDIDEDAMDEDDENWSQEDSSAPPPLPSAPTSGAITPQPPSKEQEAPDQPLQEASTSSRQPDHDKLEAPWKRFEMLPSAPPDHAYITTTPSQPSKNFMTRLTREYRVLSSSLPGKCVGAHLINSLIGIPRVNHHSGIRGSSRSLTKCHHGT